MKTRLLKAGAFLSVLSLLALLPGSETRSCGPETDETQYRFSLFRPDLDSLSGLEPFYYAARFLNSAVPDPAGADSRRNCEEWARYCGGSVRQEDIYKIQYDCSPDEFCYAAGSGDWGGLEGNGFVRWLRQPAHRAALRYLDFAKRIEFQQLGNKDPWNDESYYYPAASPAAPDSLLRAAMQGCARKSDSFLQQRYAFQAVKLCHYTEGEQSASGIRRDSGLAVYTQLLRNSNTVVADWGLVYYAGLLQDSTARFSALVQAFLRSDEKKVYAYQMLSEGNLHSLLASTRDSSLLAGAYTLLALKTPGRSLELLRRAAQFRAADPYLPVLIGREVVKLEDWLWSEPMLGLDPESYYARLNAGKDRTYCRDFIAFLQSLAVRRESVSGYALLAAAHLSNVSRDYAAAARLLQRVPALPSQAWEQQRIIDGLIAAAHLSDVRSAATQEVLIRGIRLLQEAGLRLPGPQQSVEGGWDFNADPAENETADNLPELLLLLSKRFELAGDRLRAGLLYRKTHLLTSRYDGSYYHSDYWAKTATDSSTAYPDFAYFDRCNSVPLMDSLLAFGAKTPASAFDRFLAEEKVPANFYLDLKGTIHFRNGDYKAALAVFNQMPDSFWEHEYEFAFYLPQTDIGSVGGLIPGEKKGPNVHPISSKKWIVRDLVRIEDSLKLALPEQQRAVLLYRMGNALFNTSYHGKGWMMFSYGKSSIEPQPEDDSWYQALPLLYRRYADRYYRMVPAMRCYQSAVLAAGKNRELAARCLLMLAHCDKLQQEIDASLRRKLINHSLWGGPDDDEPGPPSAYLQRLRRDYSRTELYRLAATHCPDVKTGRKR